MALINCPECNQQISTFAENCPQCGAPVNNTNKKLKLHLIIASVIFIAGSVWLFTFQKAVLASIIVCVAAAWYGVIKFKIWLNNKE